jgi:uncharacterized membrane protein YqhA
MSDWLAVPVILGVVAFVCAFVYGVFMKRERQRHAESMRRLDECLADIERLKRAGRGVAQ